MRFFAGDFLREQGLNEVHLFALGCALSLMQASLLRHRLHASAFGSGLNHCCLALAGLLLALAAGNFLGRPNLDAVNAWSLGASAFLVWLAGTSFRRAARDACVSDSAQSKLCERLHQAALTLTL